VRQVGYLQELGLVSFATERNNVNKSRTQLFRYW